MLDKTIWAFIVFTGLVVLTGCDFNPLDFDQFRTYKVSDLTGEYKATTPDGEEILILCPDMTFLQKYQPKNSDQIRENKGPWELRDNKNSIYFVHMLTFWDFPKEGDALEPCTVLIPLIRKSKGKIILECHPWPAPDPVAYRWIKYK